MRGKIILALMIIATIGLFLLLDLGRYLNLETIKGHNYAIHAFYQEYPLKTAALYFLIYVLVASFSLPGATLTALVGGGIFGVVQGTVIISLASTIGATLAFLSSRYLFRDWLRQRFATPLATIDEGIQRDGSFYLFTLRLVPAFPFFMINLLMGLTAMRTSTYFLVSQLGMLPGTIVYVNAGTRIGELDSIDGIFSMKLTVSFAILGIFPLLAKPILRLVQQKRAK